MNISKNAKHIYTILWLIVLFAFGLVILHINLSKNPEFYCTDMYSDMVYATQVWEKRSLFPDEWVFGNQLYTVATPVLAALFFGILHDPCIAMGIASTFMGICVIYSFCWMLKPLFAELHERLFASVLFMILILLCGDPIYAINGWQLFFTMCSYYACYAITAFLAFGCYIRSNTQWKTGLHLVLACVLAFGTGVQSLRQTAVMTVPLIAVECLKLFNNYIYKKSHSYKSALIVIALSVSNLSGILYAQFLDVSKNEIFGSMSLSFPSNLGAAIQSCFSTAFNLFSSYSKFAAIVLSITCLCVAIILFQKHDWNTSHFSIFLLLHIISISGILFLDLFTTIYVREIYYFMLFPFMAIIFTFVYARSIYVIRLLVVILIICTLPSCEKKLAVHMLPFENDHPMQQVSDYLKQNEISTVYSHWNFGEKIAIASDFDIRVGFWDYSMDVFNSVKYLCDPSIFDADIANCAYVVSGKETFNKATEVAEKRGACLQFMNHFPELDVFIFTSDQKLMN